MYLMLFKRMYFIITLLKKMNQFLESNLIILFKYLFIYLFLIYGF